MARSEAAKKENVTRQPRIRRVEIRMSVRVHEENHTDAALNEKCFLSCFGEMKLGCGGYVSAVV